MKRVICIVFTLCFIMSASAYSKGLKIGYADFLKIFNGYTKTKDYEKAIEKEKNKAEHEGKLEDKKNMIVKMQDKLNLLKGKEKAQQEEEIKKAITEYRNMAGKIYSDLKKESNQKMEDIVNSINKTIKGYAIKNNFDLIINKNIILYGKDSSDITEDILNKVNEEYKKK